MAADERAAAGVPYIGDPRDMLGTSEYTRLDRIGAVIGLAVTFSVVYPQVQAVDHTIQANRLQVPIYLVEGRNDLNNWAPTVQQYFDVLEAPYKELIWFERAGHNVCYEEAKAFNELPVQRLLRRTLPAGKAAA